MCLIVFAHQVRPDTALLLAANRDEFFQRPTRQANFWGAEGHPHLLAGKDLKAGGTWLGITNQGRFATVTNIRDPSQTGPKPRSRGELTLEFLISDITPAAYCEQLTSCYDDFAGYNLLLSDGDTLFYANNLERKHRPLKPGIYALSNGLLDSPWPKVQQSRKALTELLDSDNTVTPDHLIALLQSRTPADDPLPDTGLPAELERALSAPFIVHPQHGYGTVSTTGLMAGPKGTLFAEQNYDSEGNPTAGHYYELGRH